MSFKIVQTKELGHKKPSLCVIPAGWEIDNILYWPNTRRVSTLAALVEDGKSLPTEGWLTQPCIKKREHFLTYEAANSEMEEMTRRSDSEKENNEDIPTAETGRRLRVKQKARTEIGRSPQRDFNDLIKMPTNNNNIENSQDVNNEDTILFAQPFSVHPTVYQNHQNSTQNFDINDDQLNATDENNITCQVIRDDNNLETIISNQEKIIKELASQRVMLDFLCELSTASRDFNVATTAGGTRAKQVAVETRDSMEFNQFPINSEEDLIKLETDLLNEDYKAKIVQQMSTICGTSGKMNGTNCCYAVVDSFFNRKLLTRFSWCGGSRDPDAKSRFKSYKNVISIFYDIIAKADCSFSLLDAEKFFKSIIKNAKRRASIIESNAEKKTRASRGKARPQNLQYNRGTDKTIREVDALDDNAAETGENNSDNATGGNDPDAAGDPPPIEDNDDELDSAENNNYQYSGDDSEQDQN